VLRVEQLLLQIEQQELKRQRENLILRKNLARRELDEGVKMLMTNNFTNSSSLQDINAASNGMSSVGNVAFEHVNNNSNNNVNNNNNNNVTYRHHHIHNNIHPHQHNHNEYRKSMPNLQDFNASWSPNANELDYSPTNAFNEPQYQYSNVIDNNGMIGGTSSRSEMHLHAPKPYQSPASQQQTQFMHRNSTTNINNSNNNIYGNMTRHALMQISAVPKPKLTNDWVQYRKSEPVKPSLNSHWLIQEAEQRRIEQMNNVRSGGFSKRPLPDAIIQTITQRVVDLGIGSNVNKR
jgi:hypothetical protein